MYCSVCSIFVASGFRFKFKKALGKDLPQMPNAVMAKQPRVLLQSNSFSSGPAIFPSHKPKITSATKQMSMTSFFDASSNLHSSANPPGKKIACVAPLKYVFIPHWSTDDFFFVCPLNVFVSTNRCICFSSALPFQSTSNSELQSSISVRVPDISHQQINLRPLTSQASNFNKETLGAISANASTKSTDNVTSKSKQPAKQHCKSSMPRFPSLHLDDVDDDDDFQISNCK